MSATDLAIAGAVAAQRGWVQAFFDALATIGRDDPGITRDTFGEGESRAHLLLRDHGQTRGLEVARFVDTR